MWSTGELFMKFFVQLQHKPRPICWELEWATGTAAIVTKRSVKPQPSAPKFPRWCPHPIKPNSKISFGCSKGRAFPQLLYDMENLVFHCWLVHPIVCVIVWKNILPKNKTCPAPIWHWSDVLEDYSKSQLLKHSELKESLPISFKRKDICGGITTRKISLYLASLQFRALLPLIVF